MTSEHGICCSECGHFRCKKCLPAADYTLDNENNSEHVTFASGLRGGMLSFDEISAINSCSSVKDGASIIPINLPKQPFRKVECCQCGETMEHRNASICVHCGHEICKQCKSYGLITDQVSRKLYS